MSVRKRLWFTSKQVREWAAKLAGDAGDPDLWPKYRDAAQSELTALLRRARAKDASALKALKRFPPKEAWVVDYVDQTGTRCFATFDKKKDADDHHSTVKVDVRKGIHVAPKKSLTVTEAGENWINNVEAEGCERSTIKQYREHLDLHITPRIGRTKLAEINEDRVKAFRDDLLAGMSRSLARKVLTSFKSLLKNAKWGHVAADVSIGKSERDHYEIEAGRDFPTPAEVKRLINAATNPRLHALLLTATLTGLRASELRGLRWKDVDLDNCELRVRQRADRWCKIGPPKSKKSRRTIPLDPEILIPALKKWKLKSAQSGDGHLVFPTGPGHVEHHSNLLRSLAPVMIAAGVTAPVLDDKGEAVRDEDGNPLIVPKYALHACRHFFASWCINPKNRGGRELPPKEVQTQMGHSSIKITFDIYGHLFPSGNDRTEVAAATRALFA
jgi:integrase